MQSYSQAGQDIFVRRILGENFRGTFLDIGCASDQFSNTLALEEEGWTGLLIDCDCNAAKGRKSPFICADASKAKLDLPEYVDYLSLDTDHATLDCLRNIDLKKTRFGIITIEHDAYRFGDELRLPERHILARAGYHLICADVRNDLPFEDWHVSKELYTAAEPFICNGKNWKDILGIK